MNEKETFFLNPRAPGHCRLMQDPYLLLWHPNIPHRLAYNDGGALSRAQYVKSLAFALEFVMAATVTRGFFHVEALLSSSRYKGDTWGC
jgi:hypothetical protein